MLYVNSMQIGYTVDPRSSFISPSWHSQHNHPKGFYFSWHVPYYFQTFTHYLVSLLPTFLISENRRLHIQGSTKHLQNPQSSQWHMGSRPFYKNQFSDIRIDSFQKLSHKDCPEVLSPLQPSLNQVLILMKIQLVQASIEHQTTVSLECQSWEREIVKYQR